MRSFAIDGERMSTTPRNEPPSSDRAAAAAANRREHQRVPGPFDGLRVDALETPIRIYDLSRGGCFITAMHSQTPGVRLTLRIDLPYEGWVTVAAETLARHDEAGFAVRFVDMDPDNAARLERALKRLEARAPHH
jgi:hypothetical protein